MAFEIELHSERLDLRPLRAGDLDEVAELGADGRVMEWFGGPVTRSASGHWLERQLEHWDRHGLGRFHVARDGRFVGVVGLSRAEFDAGVVPGVEIAWRLVHAAWGRGYATEAARLAAADGFERVGLTEIIAVTTPGNVRSRRVMERLGMRHAPDEEFDHPRLPPGHRLRRHVLYRLVR
ncbi:MAG: GNAT family N-acetyltransferase [Myxococcales bacterium]|nr:GNAT family N-acetyltransferase [Myxococcales bacterium]